MSEQKRCEAEVYRRDTYRLRRGRGFQMHYERGQCERLAKEDGLCWQHAKLRERWGDYYVTRVRQA